MHYFFLSIFLGILAGLLYFGGAVLCAKKKETPGDEYEIVE